MCDNDVSVSVFAVVSAAAAVAATVVAVSVVDDVVMCDNDVSVSVFAVVSAAAAAAVAATVVAVSVVDVMDDDASFCSSCCCFDYVKSRTGFLLLQQFAIITKFLN
jgi:hypothetical protein